MTPYSQTVSISLNVLKAIQGTNKEIADNTKGISEVTVSKWTSIRNDSNPSLVQLKHLLDSNGFSLQSFMELVSTIDRLQLQKEIQKGKKTKETPSG